jgi:hypothetical protein
MVEQPPIPVLPDGYTFSGWEAMSWQGHVIKDGAQPPYNSHIVVVGHNPLQETVDALTAKAINNLGEVIAAHTMPKETPA